MREKIHEQFQKHFGGSGEFYASAGRINLIGEHTDYNGGFVFPGAIDKGMMPNSDSKKMMHPLHPGPVTYSESAWRPSNTAGRC